MCFFLPKSDVLIKRLWGIMAIAIKTCLQDGVSQAVNSTLGRLDVDGG